MIEKKSGGIVFSKAKLTISLAILIIALGAYLLFTYINSQISADGLKTITINGYTHYSISDSIGNYSGSSRMAPGAKVVLLCDDSMCSSDQKEYTAYSDVNGRFVISVQNPAPCAYRVIAGGNDKYNARDNGKIKLIGGMAAGGAVGLNVVVDDQVDLMYSKFSGNAYEEGYNGYYHLSQWDNYIIRNRISTGLVVNPVSPSSVTLEVPIAAVNGAWPGMVNRKGLEIPIILSAHAVISGWKNGEMPPVSSVLDEQKMTVSRETKDKTIKFNVSLAGLTKEQRFQAYKNGIAVSYKIDESSNPDQKMLDSWKNVNADLIIKRSEDNNKDEIVFLSYSGSESYQRATIGFDSPLLSPIKGREKLVSTSDFGYRGIAQSICHRGMDFATGHGEQIQAVSDGIIVESSYHSAYGEHVIIKHCNNMYTWYGHMISGSRKVSVGQTVAAGTVLGLSDNTGSSSGNHLHFSVAFGSPTHYVDPFLFLSDRITSINVDEHPGQPRRNKGIDPATRYKYLKDDPCTKQLDYIISI